MKVNPKFQTELNRYEQMIMNCIKNNFPQNQKKISEVLKISKNTTPKYLKKLLDDNYVELAEINEKGKFYVPIMQGNKTLAESHKLIRDNFDYIKFIIRKRIQSLENKTHSEKVVDVYSQCVELIFAYDKIIRFTIAINRQNKLLKQWLDLQKENEEFLDEIINKTGRIKHHQVLLKMEKTTSDILKELENNKTENKKR